MEARDFRDLGRPAQEALRRRALFLIERGGMTQGQAAVVVRVHRQTVNIWFKRYQERGEDGMLDGRRVSPRRGKGLLTALSTHQPTRRRERQMQRFKSARHAQRFLSSHGQIHNHFQLRRHLLTAIDHRAARDRAFQIWRDVAGIARAA